jgi:hypothetical protein
MVILSNSGYSVAALLSTIFPTATIRFCKCKERLDSLLVCFKYSGETINYKEEIKACVLKGRERTVRMSLTFNNHLLHSPDSHIAAFSGYFALQKFFGTLRKLLLAVSSCFPALLGLILVLVRLALSWAILQRICCSTGSGPSIDLVTASITMSVCRGLGGFADTLTSIFL